MSQSMNELKKELNELKRKLKEVDDDMNDLDAKRDELKFQIDLTKRGIECAIKEEERNKMNKKNKDKSTLDILYTIGIVYVWVIFGLKLISYFKGKR